MYGERSLDPLTPVIVGVGQHLNRGDEAIEPVALMEEALRAASTDAGSDRVLASAEVIAVVPTFSWRYSDPGRLLAGRIGATEASTWYATVGGNTPQMLVNRLALQISQGRCDLGVVCGGEASRSRRQAKQAGGDVPWPRQGDGPEPDWHDGSEFSMAHPSELERGIAMPTQVYPLFENALWHASGRPLEDHLATIGAMWAGFSRVAASNPFAWSREAYSAAEITTPTDGNRMVGFPYTKRMVSNPDVNMASALILCSVQRARELGIPSERWVFLHSGTDAVDVPMSERRDFVSSAALGVAGRRALELAGTHGDSVQHLDLYSCFPSAVELALSELSISIDRQLTVYGGLSSAGGPWNNPVGHAIASMVEVLRADPGSTGLVTANGGNVDKHTFGVYSSEPPPEQFRYDRPQAAIDEREKVRVDGSHTGRAVIETWTVMHDRDGTPVRAHAACRTPDGARAWGVSDDDATMKLLLIADMAGHDVELRDDGTMTLV